MNKFKMLHGVHGKLLTYQAMNGNYYHFEMHGQNMKYSWKHVNGPGKLLSRSFTHSLYIHIYT